MTTYRTRLAVPGLLISATVALVGCTQLAPSVSDGSEPQDGGRIAAPENAGGRAAPMATAAPSEANPADRQVARTAAVSLRCADLIAAAGQLRGLAESMGGYVTSESVWTNGESTSATSRIVFSIPADSMERFLTDAAKVGDLVTRSVTARDVTDQVVDVNARIRTLRDSISRIRALMSRTGSIAEIARVEQELTERQSELEALLARQKALRNQVERSPITVTLLRPGQTDAPNPFLLGLIRGWEAMQRSITWLLAALGGILPFALVGAAVGWPAWRWLRRRTAARNAAANQQGAASQQDSANPQDSAPKPDSANPTADDQVPETEQPAD